MNDKDKELRDKIDLEIENLTFEGELKLNGELKPDNNSLSTDIEKNDDIVDVSDSIPSDNSNAVSTPENNTPVNESESVPSKDNADGFEDISGDEENNNNFDQGKEEIPSNESESGNEQGYENGEENKNEPENNGNNEENKNESDNSENKEKNNEENKDKSENSQNNEKNNEENKNKPENSQNNEKNNEENKNKPENNENKEKNNGENKDKPENNRDENNNINNKNPKEENKGNSNPSGNNTGNSQKNSQQNLDNKNNNAANKKRNEAKENQDRNRNANKNKKNNNKNDKKSKNRSFGKNNRSQKTKSPTKKSSKSKINKGLNKIKASIRNKLLANPYFWLGVVIGLVILVLFVVFSSIIADGMPLLGGEVQNEENYSKYAEKDKETIEKLKQIYSENPNGDPAYAMAATLFPYIEELQDGNVISLRGKTNKEQEDESYEEGDSEESSEEGEESDENNENNEDNETLDPYLEELRTSTGLFSTRIDKFKKLLKKSTKNEDPYQDPLTDYLISDWFKKDKGYKEMFDEVSDREALEKAIINNLIDIKDDFSGYFFDNCSNKISFTRQEIIEFARSNVGKIVYYFGGKPDGPNFEDNDFGSTVDPDITQGRTIRGLDCSGFVDFVFWHVTGENFGLGNTSEIRDNYSQEISYEDLMPGDLGFPNNGPSGTDAHVGIYVGKDENGYDVWIDCNWKNGVEERVAMNEFKLYYRPNILNGTDESYSGECEQNDSGGTNSCKSYNLTEEQLNTLALVAYNEQGSVEGVKAEASLMVNRFELHGGKYSSVYDYVLNCNWFNSDSFKGSTPSKKIVDAVRDVIINGHRTLPSYVDEHDCIYCGEKFGYDIVKLKVGDKVYTSSKDLLNHENYIKDKTIIYNKPSYGSVYTFHSFPTKNSDPFGYTKKLENECVANTDSMTDSNGMFNKNTRTNGQHSGQCIVYVEDRAVEIINSATIGYNDISDKSKYIKVWTSKGFGSAKCALQDCGNGKASTMKKLFKTSSDYTKPQAGAVIVWGTSKNGHVAVIEKVNTDGTVTVSQSNWCSNCEKFSTNTLTMDQVKNYGGNHEFIGYIYLLQPIK